MLSAMSPVPSGDPSSTTRTSRRASCARTVATSRSTFSRSLYVGTMTSARSDTSSPLQYDARDDHRGRDDEPQKRQHLSPGERRVRKPQVDRPRARGQWNADEAVLRTPDGRSLAVDHRAPAWIEVLADHESRPHRRRSVEPDRDVPRVV